jgi:hypothetical protein
MPLQLESAKRSELLSRIIAHDRLVVVTGTGVSMQTVGFPAVVGTDIAGWPGLLNSGVAYCEHHNLASTSGVKIAQQMIEEPENTDDLIDAAQRIDRWLSSRTNAKLHWIGDTIGRLEIKDASLITAIQNLGGLIGTLNYDSLIHQVTQRDIVTWKDQDRLDQYFRDHSKNFIFHIHGHWERPDTMILNRDSYSAISTDANMQHNMRTLVKWYTLVFIGCGDTFLDPNFAALMKWSNKALEGNRQRHFILCRACEEQEFLAKLQPYGFIDTIVYGDGFEDLVPFLDTLALETGAMANASNPPTFESTPLTTTRKASDVWKLHNLK